MSMWVYVSAILIVIAVIVAVVLIIVSKKKPAMDETFDSDKLNYLLDALGGTSNIMALDNTQKRVKVKVKYIKSVDATQLQTLKIPAVLKGNELTLLVKQQPQQVVAYINAKRKEDNLWTNRL